MAEVATAPPEPAGGAEGADTTEWEAGPAPVSALVRGELAEYMDYESFTVSFAT